MTRNNIRLKLGLLLLVAVIVILSAIGYFRISAQSEASLSDYSSSSTGEFKGSVEEITSAKAKIPAYYMHQSGELIAISFIFKRSGWAYEDENEQGITNILSHTLKEGAGWWSSDELRNLMGSNGIKIGFSVSQDDFSGQLTFPQDKREEAVKYAREILLNPHFEEEYVEVAKNAAIRTIETQKESPSSELSLAFNQSLFADFAYGRNPLGKIENIRSINRRSLINYLKKTLGKNKLFIGIVGNISSDEAANMIDEIFASLPDVEIKDIGVAHLRFSKPDLYIKRDIPQNIALYAAKSTCRTCDDFYPLYIANYILGGAGLNSRLNQEIREKKNLTYGISTWLDLNDLADLIMVSFSATTDNMPQAKELFYQLWQQAGRNGFSAEELKNAQNHLIASHNLRFASTFGIAEMLAYMQKYKLGIDFLNRRNQLIQSVSLEQLNQAAKKYFNNHLYKSEIGNINPKGE